MAHCGSIHRPCLLRSQVEQVYSPSKRSWCGAGRVGGQQLRRHVKGCTQAVARPGNPTVERACACTHARSFREKGKDTRGSKAARARHTRARQGAVYALPFGTRTDQRKSSPLDRTRRRGACGVQHVLQQKAKPDKRLASCVTACGGRMLQACSMLVWVTAHAQSLLMGWPLHQPALCWHADLAGSREW